MTPSFLILVNPTSGRKRAIRKAETVAAILRARDLNVEIRPTSAPGDAYCIALEAAGADNSRPSCIVACGGDGTIQEVASALAIAGGLNRETCPALGLIPAGRCNDFARGVGVTGRAEQLATVLATGKPSPIDLGRVNDRYFCTVATVGIDAEVSSYVHTMKMPLRGTPAYLYGALRVLSRYRARRLTITGDFGSIDRPLFLASSANTCSYGGSICIAPDAIPTDGLIDVCLIDAVRRLRALRLIASVLRVRHAGEPEVQFLRTRWLAIEAEQPLELWADGEPVGTTPVRIQAVPAAIRVLLPV